jgi:colanic acid/amylovoran biosynthesis glycosyltransferase
MPEVTVSMPAYNAGKYIQQAIDSVLHQDGIEVELLVVDDGSTDDTAAIVAACSDPRVRLLRNGRRMGIGYCHNVVLRESRSPAIAHVDADDFLRPGALRKVVDALRSDAGVGQAHCYFLDVDSDGRATRDACRKRWMSFRRNRPPTLDYKTAVVSAAGVINHLRTYRRSVLEELGGFNERIPFAVDYDMALRVLDRYRIKLVPEYLYCRRLHAENTTESLRFKRVRFWVQQYRIRRQLARAKKVHFLSGVQFDFHKLLGAIVRDAWQRRRRGVRTAWDRCWVFLRFRVVAPLSAILYRTAINRLSWWPLSWSWLGRARGRDATATAPEHLAYYVQSFPILSETFIQREIAALRRAGLTVDVVARRARDEAYLDDDARRLKETTHYLDPMDPERLAAYKRRFFARRPLAMLNVFLYFVLRRHSAEKSYANDQLLFNRAVYLAGVLEEKGVTRVHSPWAFGPAMTALAAARLLQIRYTVQARASDIHRRTSAVGLHEKLVHAECVITNAHYNESVIRSLLPPGSDGKIRTIYEGIDLRRFQPRDRGRERPSVARILSVARLVEPKGLEYLIAACRILRDAGHAVHCEVIGGRASSEMNYYLKLQKLRRSLGVEAEVTFLGAQPFDRVLEKYREVDVFVLPAVQASDGRRDVTPNALIEAMAMKLPVVSTRSGAISEIVDDGVSGLLVPPRDEAALAQAIMRLLDDAALRQQLGDAARKRVEERFDINKNVAAYVTLFGGAPPRAACPAPAPLDAEECATRA